MEGIFEALLRLEGAKHKALIQTDASAFEEHVRAQLRLLESSSISPADLETAARKSPQIIDTLSRLIRLNTALFANLFTTSSVFALNQNQYTANGTMEPQLGNRIGVEA
jgi:hypothetical protein